MTWYLQDLKIICHYCIVHLQSDYRGLLIFSVDSELCECPCEE